MKTKWSWFQDGLAVAFITTGLVWGISRQLTVHAQQSSGQPVQPANAGAASTLKLENGKLQARELNGSLGDTVNRWAAGATQPQWLGYSVVQVSGKRTFCCWHGNGENYGGDDCGTCPLEKSNSGTNFSDNGPSGVKLEGPRELAVLYRAESGKIGQIRVFSENCTVDAGGLSVVWLQGVKPSESVAYLSKFARADSNDSAKGEKLDRSALAAIALHADPSAIQALESFVAPGAPESLRKETAFWLAEARGAEGFQILQRMAQSDPSPDVRKQVTFAFSISKEPGALSEMIRMAHDDQSPQVRGQALFWLGQKAGEKAAKAITGSIENDPDTEVKKKAVFALSQMPPEQGVPKLILVAQTNHNPQVRKAAMFWLGQSNDPQALVFFEKVLNE